MNDKLLANQILSAEKLFFEAYQIAAHALPRESQYKALGHYARMHALILERFHEAPSVTRAFEFLKIMGFPVFKLTLKSYPMEKMLITLASTMRIALDGELLCGE